MDLFKKFSDSWWQGDGAYALLQNMTQARLKFINNYLLKENTILDYGCGGGLLSLPLSNNLQVKNRVVAMDRDHDTVAHNRHTLNFSNNLTFLTMDEFLMEQDKYAEYFNMVIVSEVLEHVDNWQNTLKSVDAYLKPGGVLIISTINRNLLSKIGAIYLAEYLLRLVPKGMHNYKSFITPREIMDYLAQLNFICLGCRGLRYSFFKQNWRISLNYAQNYMACFVKNSNLDFFKTNN